MEMLLIHSNIDSKETTQMQNEAIGGLMNRHLKQIDLENKLNFQIAKASHENMLEFLFFQKILLLSRELSQLDLKDFLAMKGNSSSTGGN